MRSQEIILALREKLRILRDREFRVLFLERLIPSVAISAGILFAMLLIEAVFRLSGYGRGILLLLGSGGIACTAVYYMARPMVILAGRDRNFDDEHVAARAGEKLPRVRDRLVNVLQLSRLPSDKGVYSPSLIHAAIEKQGSAIIVEDFVRLVTYDSVKGLSRKIIPYFFIAAAPLLISFNSFYTSFQRVVHPGTEFPEEDPFTLKVAPGNTQIVRGLPLAIAARAGNGVPDNVEILIREQGDDRFAPVTARAEGDSFAYRLEKVTTPFSYFVRGTRKRFLRPDQRVLSPEYNVAILYRPSIRRLKIRLDAPSYSGLGSYYLEDNIGDITALKGTNISIELSANKAIGAGIIKFRSGKEALLEFYGNSGKGSFTLSEEGAYSIHLNDEEGIGSDDPIEYGLTFLPDEYPFIQILSPGRNVDIDETMRLPLYFRVMDDYGPSRARLISYEVETDENGEESAPAVRDTATIALNNANDRMQDINYDWDISKKGLAPNDRMAYYIDVYDNDIISGPKKTSSETFYIRFPSLEEIFSKVDQTQDESISELEEILKEHTAIEEKVKEIVQELRRDQNLNFEKEQVLKSAVDKEKNLMEKAMKVEERYEEILRDLEKNDLSSLETLQKYMELQQLFREIMTPELEKAMENLNRSLEEEIEKNDKIQEQVEKFAESQAEIREKIERTLNLLKQVQAEQKLDELVKKAEELALRQEEVNKTLKEEEADARKQEDKKPDNLGELSQKEQELEAKTGDVEKEVKEFADQMKKKEGSETSPLDKSSTMLEERKVRENMQKMSGELARKSVEEAARSGEEIERDLEEFAESLEQSRDAMRAGEKERLAAKMRRTMQDLLELSKQEEKISGETKDLNAQSPEFGDMAEKQMNVMSGLSKTAQQFMELSQQTFFVTPQMGRALGEAMSQMQQAISGLEGRNSGQAAQNQDKAMGALNQAAQAMAGAMMSMGGSQSALGFQQYLEMLEQAAKGQEGLNQRTEGMFGKQPGTPGQGDMMQLAREQAALQKLLEDIQNQMGERSEILGRLDEIGRDMGDVANEMKEAQVNRKTIERQRSILSRLLDAQRSLQKQEFTKERKSETAKEYDARSPEELTMEDINKSNLLQEELLRALEEGYSKDFRALIRRYYEALGKTESRAPATQ